ncbi:hypothetical protein JCM11491_003444 [Sporobolomyces phaffii]
MSFSALAGGSECGPVNPLAQLSKTFAHDRGVQQDHFGSHAGSSQQSFRHSPVGPSSSPAASLLPSDPAAAHFFQPHSQQSFDLSNLHRALSPAPAPAVPAWAQAFQNGAAPAAHSSQEHALFSHAFGRSNSATAVSSQQQNATPPAWAQDFSASRLDHSSGAATPRSQSFQAQGPKLGATRLLGQGFMNGGGMMQHNTMGIGMGQVRTLPAKLDAHGFDTTLRPDSATDWETAFLAQEASTSTRSEDAAVSSSPTTASHYRDHVTETRPLTPPLRAHTPIDESTARDALAQTAAALLSTVASSEDQRTRSGLGAATATNQEAQMDQLDHHRAIGDKFAQSSFMDLMRRLRDGQVAVEGDKVVEQVRPYGSVEGSTTRDKGKARADGWVDDFSATATREEEGRVNQGSTQSTRPPRLRPGVNVEDHARAQHDWATRQVDSAAANAPAVLRQEVERSYETMSGLWDDEDRVREQRERNRGAGGGTERPLQFQGDGGSMVVDDEVETPQYDTRVHLAQSSWEEDFDDASMIVGGHSLGGGQARRKSLSAQQKEWDLLQDSWDEFEVTAAGLKPKDPVASQQQASTSSTAHGYSFAQNNPYLLHQRESNFASPSATTHHHAHHSASDAAALSSARIDSLFQHEADVQTEPHNATAWFSLGLKQQENEREELAISALQRAIELDPTVARGAAHLALAISFTNESRRGAAYEQIDRWVDVLAQQSSSSSSDHRTYANEIAQYRNLFGPTLPETSTERHQYLTGLLIRLAQSGTESMGGEVDADVQVAMGVLFNSSEEYEKAGDCFEAALAVRPDDPLLYNRLGATYANSGKTELAIQYYLAALDLQPGYVRARFNLAVANMNQGNYEEAIHHLLTSLSVQQADSEHEQLVDPTPSNEPPSGVTSQTLWDSLNVSLIHMGRSDLSELAAKKDLQGLLRELGDDV